MAILLKRSTVASVVPDPAELQVGELAVNSADGKLFTKDTAAQVVDLTRFRASYPSVEPNAGYYLSAHLSTQTYATIAGVANRINWMPFIALRDRNITALTGYCTTAVASAAIRMAVYADDGTGKPTGDPLVATSALDCSTTGFKEEAVSLSMTAGNLYWLALQSSSTATLRAYSRLGLAEVSVNPATTVGINGWYRNGLSFVSPFPTLPTVIYEWGTTTPAVFLKTT